jgi:hypothetical protein
VATRDQFQAARLRPWAMNMLFTIKRSYGIWYGIDSSNTSPRCAFHYLCDAALHWESAFKDCLHSSARRFDQSKLIVAYRFLFQWTWWSSIPLYRVTCVRCAVRQYQALFLLHWRKCKKRQWPAIVASGTNDKCTQDKSIVHSKNAYSWPWR